MGLGVKVGVIVGVIDGVGVALGVGVFVGVGVVLGWEVEGRMVGDVLTTPVHAAKGIRVRNKANNLMSFFIPKTLKIMFLFARKFNRINTSSPYIPPRDSTVKPGVKRL